MPLSNLSAFRNDMTQSRSQKRDRELIFLFSAITSYHAINITIRKKNIIVMTIILCNSVNQIQKKSIRLENIVNADNVLLPTAI